MFYNRNWLNVSIDEFIDEVNKYIEWYSHKRRKLSLGGLNPLSYRKSLGLLAGWGSSKKHPHPPNRQFIIPLTIILFPKNKYQNFPIFKEYFVIVHNFLNTHILKDKIEF